MDIIKNEIIEYLIKFVDETVCVWSNSSNEHIIGQCTQLKLDNTNSNHITMVITDENSVEHVYDIWEYNYKTHTWYDGIRKKDFSIKRV